MNPNFRRFVSYSGVLCLMTAICAGCPLFLQPPETDFAGIPQSGPVPLEVEFTSLSTPGTSVITSWNWDFGDGQTGTGQSVTHVYEEPGDYTVVLRVRSLHGVDSETKEAYITAETVPPTASFTGTPTSGLVPLEVEFEDTSDQGTSRITSREWDFGDGVTSRYWHPDHTYEEPGTYTVSLTVTTAHGEDTEIKEDYVTVATAPPTAAFETDVTNGPAPLEVSFEDVSQPGTADIDAWSWNFGDGQTGAEASPVHVYEEPGTYTVSLTVTTAHGDDTEVKQDLIEVEAVPPTAAFTVEPDAGLVPFEVEFTDVSDPGTAGITSWSWNFGDGDTSVEQNPVHSYTVPGEYSVSLTVTTAHGEDTLTEEELITAATAPIDLVDVSEGWFMMGARKNDPAPLDAMLPRHNVELSAYQIGTYEVTNDQFCDVLNWANAEGLIEVANGDIYAYDKRILVTSSDYCQITYDGEAFVAITRDGVDTGDHPVVEVTWHGAAVFCNWLCEMTGLDSCYDTTSWSWTEPLPNGFRLPTEAEWERAAGWDASRDDELMPDMTTGGQWLYGCTNDWISALYVNYDKVNPLDFSLMPYTTPVGYYNGLNPGTEDASSPVGCYDMSGNVWEWCHDGYASYTADAVTNPMGDPDSTLRSWRGGAWLTTAENHGQCRSAYRSASTPEAHQSFLGFRVGRSLRSRQLDQD